MKKLTLQKIASDGDIKKITQKTASGAYIFQVGVTLQEKNIFLETIPENEVQEAIRIFLRKVLEKDKTLSQVDYLAKLNEGLMDKKQITNIGHILGLQVQYLKDKGYELDFEKSGIIFDNNGAPYLRLVVNINGINFMSSIYPAKGAYKN